MPFDSDEAYSLNKKIFATIYFNAWDESSSLCKRTDRTTFLKDPLLRNRFYIVTPGTNLSSKDLTGKLYAKKSQKVRETH